MTPPRLMHGDCLRRMAEIPAGSVDAIICDPPYPEISRPYGRMTEAGWHAMMRGVVAEARRVLAPSGSAVFVLQPNSARAGRMRPWLWEFMAWTSREWGMVQDAWWWNHATLPCGGATQFGLLRGSLKACVWLGGEACYRDQGAVLWAESGANRAQRLQGRFGRKDYPSGQSVDPAKISASAAARGGVTPFNVLPFAPSGGKESAGAFGHGAGTPEPLCDWWTRYISPPGGVVCDPFMGVGTTGLAALKRGRRYVGIERDPGYFAIAERRLAEAFARTIPASPKKEAA